MAKHFLSIEIGNTESSSSVATSCFRFSQRKQTGDAEFEIERKQLSSQLTRQIRPHKDLQGIYWKICNELDAENAECQERKEIKGSRWSFFRKGKTHMHETNARGNTRELHLELGGDKFTYVRVYWLRSQVRSLDLWSYSSFKLENEVTNFSFKHLDIFTSFWVALTHDLE